MKRLTVTGWIWVAMVAVATHARCQTAADSGTETTLARLQMTYASELGKLDAERGTQSVSLQTQYLKSLETLQSQLQKNGKLEPILAVRAERERFEKEKTVDPNTPTEIQELWRVQAAYLAALRELDVSHSRKILELAGKYDRSLNSLQERVTREGKLDTAILIKTQRQELTERPEIASASFTVAETEAAREQAAADEKSLVEPESAPGGSQFQGEVVPHIRKRFREFCDALAKDDMDKARSYVDPEFVERKGSQAVNGVLALLAGPYVKITRALHGQLDPGTIEIGEDGTTASNRPRIWAENRWKETRPTTHWILRGDEWYVAMEKRSGMPARRDGDPKDGERRGRPPGNVRGDGIPPRQPFREDT